jgi:hypothetical protein
MTSQQRGVGNQPLVRPAFRTMLGGGDYKNSEGGNQSKLWILYTRLVGLEAGTYGRSRCWRTAWAQAAWGVEVKRPRVIPTSSLHYAQSTAPRQLTSNLRHPRASLPSITRFPDPQCRYHQLPLRPGPALPAPQPIIASPSRRAAGPIFDSRA